MSPEPNSNATVSYRLTALEEAKRDHDRRIDGTEKATEKHDLELHGERGIYSAVRDLSLELKWTRRALWGLAAAMVLASVVFSLGTIGGAG